MPTDDIDDLTDGQDSTGADGLALTGAELRDTFPSRRYHGQLHERFTLPAEPASHVPAREVLRADLAATLEVDPWSHQAEALEALSDGENVCVATSTSSGKTYVYGLHVARRFRENPDVRALLVYPTKALSRDQERELNDLFDSLGTGRHGRRLRRRHETRGEGPHPRGGERRHHEFCRTESVPRGTPPLGRVPRGVRTDRDRRSALVDGNQRDARRLDPPADPAADRLVRRRSTVRADDRDDRQPGRTRPRADRGTGDGDRRGRLAERSPPPRVLGPADGRWWGRVRRRER